MILPQREDGSAAGKPIEIDDCSSDLEDLPSVSCFTVSACRTQGSTLTRIIKI